MNKQKKKLPLAMQIFIALILAIVVGLLIQSHATFAENYIKPFGTIFLNLLKFIIVPIVLFSIMCGIISMRDIKKVGAIGLKTVVYYMCTTAFAITIGLIGGNVFQRFFPVIATTDLAYEMPEKMSVMDTIVNIFPSNFISPMVESNMLQVIVIALLLGFSIIGLGEKNGGTAAPGKNSGGQGEGQQSGGGLFNNALHTQFLLYIGRLSFVFTSGYKNARRLTEAAGQVRYMASPAMRVPYIGAARTERMHRGHTVCPAARHSTTHDGCNFADTVHSDFSLRGSCLDSMGV